MLNPHLFCKPIAKRYEDREALREVALSGHPKVMFGSDSAPHPQDAKEAHFCSAGVFTAPIALQLLTELFLENSNLDNLQKFISDNGQNIYKNLELVPKRGWYLEEEESLLISLLGYWEDCLFPDGLDWGKEGFTFPFKGGLEDWIRP